jgi:hypothetical protein
MSTVTLAQFPQPCPVPSTPEIGSRQPFAEVRSSAASPADGAAALAILAAIAGPPLYMTLAIVAAILQ